MQTPATVDSTVLTQSVAVLSGIGGQTAKRLQKIGINKIQDLLFHLPSRYEDRTKIYPLGALTSGMSVVVCGRIDFTDVLMQGRGSLVCRISDGTGFITLRFFHFSARQRMALQVGEVISCFAEVRHGYAGLEMIHPEYKLLASPDACATETCLTPVYPLTEGLRQATLRKAIKQAVTICATNRNALPDWLPEAELQALQYPNLFDAIQTLHAPGESISAEDLKTGKLPALKRLAFEEFLAHHLSLLQSRNQSQALHAPLFKRDQNAINSFVNALPFTLTAAQQRVINEIEVDCTRDTPMMRLIQGDVGSGKTVVAAYAALLALSAGYQVAVMAPTELLAEQHYKNFNTWFGPLHIQAVYLSSQQKGKQRQEILQAIADGSAGVVIGTHALFQNAVNFFSLGLIIIDEQHRFGVHQRLALREKGEKNGLRPHQLVMTATPIPRTLAMLRYADLDISIINELPPGRKPVVTSVIPATRREDVIARISGWIKQGQQAYWVCTLIEDSEALQCEAAENTLEKLSLALPNIRISLVHGRMKSAEKEQTMLAFKAHQIDLLVATTVIEVGVDVPNAGLMIIENPERLGLSQLHQLRGRVGRGPGDSYCLLMYQPPLSETAHQRLGILRETSDGFVIADKDLQLRGPGEVMGTRQTGQIQFRIADLSRDVELLPKVQHTAEVIQAKSPESIQPLIERWLGDTAQYAEV
jgi:ATP-dependent DNA helicase RecG